MRSLTRRTLITRMGLGVGLLLPMWRTMIPEVMGQESQRKRMLVYAGAVSASPSHFPTSHDGGGLKLHDSFGALNPYRQKMNFLRGLNAPWHKQLHGPDWFMTGKGGKPGGITLDRYIAKEIGKRDPVSSIQLAMLGCAGSVNSVSADGAGKVFPAQHDPVKAYTNTFGSGIMPQANPVSNQETEAERLLADRRSLLDFINGDIRRTNAKLAGPERAKLDQYLTSLREMENELSNLVQAQAANQSGGGQSCSATKPKSFGRPGATANVGFIDAQMSVAVNALICGMTSVAVLHKNCSGNYPGGVGNHTMWHGGDNNKKSTYFKFHSGNMAKMWKRLEDANVADNSLFFYFERCGIRHHNGQGDSFLMTIGSAGGYLNTGRYYDFRNKGHNINDGFVSIANAMGVNTNKFGDHSKGPLPGLKA